MGCARVSPRVVVVAQARPAILGRARLAHPYAGRAVLGPSQIVLCVMPPVWPSPFGHLYHDCRLPPEEARSSSALLPRLAHRRGSGRQPEPHPAPRRRDQVACDGGMRVGRATLACLPSPEGEAACAGEGRSR
jgi:hypothetical protein